MRNLIQTLGIIPIIIAWASPTTQGQSAIEAQIKEYRETLSTEEVHVHLSESVVGAGESIWFQAMILDTDTLAKLSEVVYLELVNEQSSVAQGIYKASAGRVAGQLPLPDTLSSGWYQLQAYTQYMSNAHPAGYFTQPVLVVNATRPSDRSPDAARRTPSVSFFPEGGHWIEGVEHRLVVQANSRIVSPEPQQIEIIQSEDSTVVAEVSLIQGVGMVSLQPEENQSYVARLSSSGDTIYETLPEASATGYALQARIEGEALQIRGSSKGVSEAVQLIVHTYHELLYHESYQTSSFSATVPFSTASGLLEVALLDEQGAYIARRMVYVPPAMVNILINLPQETVEPREQFAINLSGENRDLTQEAMLSVAVRKIPPVSQFNLSLATLEKYGLDGLSFLRERFPSDEQALHWINQWLLTQTSSWPALLSEPKRSQSAPKENEFLLITGKVTTQQPIGEEDQVLLSIPGDDPYFEYSEIAPDGSFAIPVSRVYGEQSVILQYDSPDPDRTPQNVEWELDDPFSSTLPQQLAPAFSLTNEDWQSLTDSYRLRKRIQDVYRDPEPVKKDSVSTLPKEFRFYGAPNVRVNPDDYISLPSFEEVCRELLPGIRLKEKGGVYDFDVFDPATRDFLPNEPTLFIDGVPVRNVSFIVNFPPAEIESIETVNRRTYYGSVRLDGVIAVYTKEGNAYEQALSTIMEKADMQFYTRSRPFVTPDSLSSTMPDFRSLLYWQPKVQLSPQTSVPLSFRTADELGTFEIVVEGRTRKGELVYGRKTFEVMAPKVP